MVFTGINALKPGVEKNVGNILVINEVGSTDAYCLAHADIGRPTPTKSGYSFGGNQMDLAGNAKAREILKDILKNTGVGDNFFASIEKKLLIQGNPKALSSAEQTTINKAFATPYGRAKVDQVFAQDVREKINEVDRIVRSLPTGKIRQTLLAVEALILYLVDYHNQFHIDAKVLGNKNNGKMYNYLSGQRVEMAGGPIQLGSTICTKDLQNFGFHTDYHVSVNPKDLPRRYKNIDAYVVKNKIGVG